MRKIVSLMLLGICLVFTACEDETGVGEQAFLYQEWTHAFEEQDNSGSSQMIFRISDSQTFAIARFRQSYVLNADGSCEYLWLAPNDAHRFLPGTFDYDTTSQELRILNEDGDLYQSFTVLELSADKLVLERQ